MIAPRSGTPGPFETPGRIDGTRMRLFAEALHDPNPLHVSDEFAQGIGLPGRVAQGSMTVAIIGYAVARHVGQRHVVAIDVSLRRPLLEGRRVRVKVDPAGPGDGGADAATGDADTVVYRCVATTDRSELLAKATVTVSTTPIQ